MLSACNAIEASLTATQSCGLATALIPFATIDKRDELLEVGPSASARPRQILDSCTLKSFHIIYAERFEFVKARLQSGHFEK